jgi:hypothetical protein
MSAIDLTTVSMVKSWLSANGKPSANDTDDPNVQLCITAASMYWLWRTGRAAQNASVPSSSPFNQSVTYTETYDGNGKNKLFLRNTPCLSVTSLTINGQVMPLSSVWNQTGYVINADGKSLSIRQGGGQNTTQTQQYVLGCPSFTEGIQNIQIVYQAGFVEQPVNLELQTVPVTPGPYEITVDNPWLSDIGLQYFSTGTPLTAVLIAPQQGQYYVLGNGSYRLNALDEGVELQVSYNMPGTPPDVQLAVTQMVAINYKRKSWIDQKSQAMSHGAGTVTYRDWELPKEIRSVMVAYTRTAVT